MVVGRIKIGEPIVYTSYEEFRADYDKHRVPEGSQYDMSKKPGAVKYGYPIVAVEPEANPYQVTTRGNVFRDAERSEQKEKVLFSPPKKVPSTPVSAAAMVAKTARSIIINAAGRMLRADP